MNINNKLEKKINLLIDDIDECCEKLITNQINEGMEILNDIFSKIYNLMNIKFNEEMDNCIEKINNYFLKLEECMKLKDYILLSDVLKYEIKPMIVHWK